MEKYSNQQDKMVDGKAKCNETCKAYKEFSFNRVPGINGSFPRGKRLVLPHCYSLWILSHSAVSLIDSLISNSHMMFLTCCSFKIIVILPSVYSCIRQRCSQYFVDKKTCFVEISDFRTVGKLSFTYNLVTKTSNPLTIWKLTRCYQCYFSPEFWHQIFFSGLGMIE